MILSTRQFLVGAAFAGLLSLVACGSDKPGSNNPGGSGNGAGASALGGAQNGAGTAGQNGAGTSSGAGAGNGGSSGAGGNLGEGGRDPRPSVPDSPAGAALDTVRGVLNVAYPEFMSKQDIVYAEPNTDPVKALGFGNGKTGAMVWNQNGLTLQVSGVDLSPQTAFGAGNVALQTTPAIDAGGEFEQRLMLYDGILHTSFGDGRVVTLFGAPKSEVLGIHVEDSRENVTAISLDLSLWDVSALTNHGAVPNLDTWKTVTPFAEADVAGFSRGQSDPNGFGYTLAATVEGATFTTQNVGSSHVKLNILPSKSYTIWLAAASRLNAPNHDSVAAAKNLLAATKSAGFESTLSDYKAFWNGFWQKSFVQYESGDGAADYLENLYYLSTYMIAVGAYGNYPFHFINGVWRATQDDTKWSSAYWYWNQRDVYHSLMASNHVDAVASFNNMYSRNSAALKSFTSAHFGVDGIWVPETMGWNGNANGTVNSDFTKLIYSTGMEAAMNMYDQYRYSGDEQYLKDTVYPFMKEATKFLAAMFTKDQSGQYVMENSNAHETYWGVRNAITDIAAVKAMFPVTLALSEQLQLDADLRPTWQDVLDNVAAYPQDATTYLPHEPPIGNLNNGENVACELIWPYNVTGIAAPDYDRAVATWRARPRPYDNVWANDAIQAARLGLGQEAFDGMKIMLQKYQSYTNGMTNNTNGVFEYLGVHLLVMNESLLHSYDEKIRVFPAIPPDDTMVTRFTLLAKGGHLVSSEREAGEIKYVGIKSQLGQPVTIHNPWGDEAAQVIDLLDGSVVPTTGSSELAFATEAGRIYVLERVAKPLSGYEYAHITGEPSQGQKDLPGTACKLGIGGPPKPDTGKYEAEAAALDICTASGDSAASGFSQVTGLSPGASVTFSNVKAGAGIDVQYCTMNNPGRLSLYVDDVHNQDVEFPSTNSWGGTFAVKSITATIPQGATLKFRVDAGDAGANLDYIQIK